ncbi:hypothetical protein [Salinicola rhizosphaerae]|uniref:Uncharacterized protein n=1 Tax=Salinicola rhizosphaerae TaxID=1443141 RepID=A0ABQ3EDG2_9GAMM|nr:hypothetical protein [Salinicola rhizosphaerae]GHB30568.1 hypothetical protein GCM10009038_31700 [Salinicola rhizosphaerae]
MGRIDNISSAVPLPVYRLADGVIYRFAIKALNPKGELVLDYYIENEAQAVRVCELITRQGFADGTELEKVSII